MIKLTLRMILFLIPKEIQTFSIEASLGSVPDQLILPHRRHSRSPHQTSHDADDVSSWVETLLEW